MQGRRFSGTTVEAYISETRQKFKKTSARRDALDDSADEEEQERLERFGDWLESGAGKSKWMLDPNSHEWSSSEGLQAIPMKSGERDQTMKYPIEDGCTID